MTITAVDALSVETGLTTGTTSTATSASTLTLTASSTRIQRFTGTTAGQIVKLPAGTALLVGQEYVIINDGATDIKVQDGSSTVLQQLFPNNRTTLELADNSSTAGVWVSTGGTRDNYQDFKRAVCLQDDFVGGSATGTQSVGWTTATSGTGAGLALGTLASASNFGVVSLGTGTTATGRAALTSNSQMLFFGGGIVTFEAYVRIPTLSVLASNAFRVFIGFGDTATADQVDGVYFSYTDNQVSGNWALNTATASTRTQTDSGVAATTGYVNLRIVVNAAGTLATFYIANSLVGTISTNIPTAVANATGLIFFILKSVGTTARSLEVDYMTCTFTPTTARV